MNEQTIEQQSRVRDEALRLIDNAAELLRRARALLREFLRFGSPSCLQHYADDAVAYHVSAQRMRVRARAMLLSLT